MKTLQLEKYNIHVVTLPLPFDLDHVNCYVAVDRNGMWKIIDCGVNTEQNHAAWDQRITISAWIGSIRYLCVHLPILRCRRVARKAGLRFILPSAWRSKSSLIIESISRTG